MIRPAPNDPEVRHLAFDWLRRNPGSEASSVLAPLISATPDDPEVRHLAFDWLQRNPGREASFVLAPLVSATPNDAEVRHLALDWLQRNPGSEAAPLLVRLISTVPDDRNLRELALTWLDNNSQASEAYSVLTTLLSRVPNDQSIRDRAHEWREARRTCVVVGRPSTELTILESALMKHHITSIRLDTQEYGGRPLASTVAQMKNADFVAVVLPSVPTPPRVIYEAGVAAGLGRPVLVLSAGRMDLPFDVGAINVVRLEGANTRAVEMHLEAFLSTLPQRRRSRQIHSQKPSSQREEAHAFAWAHRE